MTDAYGHTVRIGMSGDGYRVHLLCADAQGHEAYFSPDRGPPRFELPGGALASWGGGFLDPAKARELAAALIDYADEMDGGAK